MAFWRSAGVHCALLALMLASAAAMYSDDDFVVPIDDATFQSEVLGGSDIWLVEFYAPWCGHCKALAPEYKKVAKSLDGIVKVGAVDCDEHKEACGAAGVTGFPHIQLYPHTKQKNPYTGKVAKVPETYQGPRTGKKIAEFTTSHIPTYVTKVSTADGTWDAVKGGELAKVVLLTDKEETTALYKAMSLKYNRRLLLAQGRDSDKDLMAELGVDEVPAVVVVKADGSTDRYQGAVKARALADFLEGFAAPAPEEAEDGAGTQEGAGAEKPKAKPAVFEFVPASEWERTVMESEDVWLVNFRGGGEGCDDKAVALAEAARPLRKAVRLGEVDAAAEESAALVKEMGAGAVASGKLCSQLLLFPFGADKADADPEVYEGELAAKPLQEFVGDALPNFVTRISGQVFDQFLATQATVPKIILLTSKTETPFSMRALAVNFRGRMMFADVPASDKDVTERLGVQKFPAVLLAVAQPGATEGEEAKFHVQHYGGPMNYAGLHSFAEQIAAALGLGEGASPGGAGGEDDAQGPGPAPLAEVTTGAEFRSACEETGKLCVIGVLDKSSEAHEDHLAVLAGVAGKLRNAPFTFMWVDGPRQGDFAQAMEIRPADLPTVAMLSTKKLRYASLRGEYSEGGVLEMLQGVLDARTKTFMIQEIPALVDGGVDVVVEEAEAVEEEFSLDDIMGEDVDAAMSGKADRLADVDAEIAAEQEAAARAEEEARQADKKKKKKSKKKKKKGKGDMSHDEL